MIRSSPPSSTPATRNRFVVAGAASLLFWILLRLVAPGSTIPWTRDMLEAARTMDSALVVISRHCLEEGIVSAPGLSPGLEGERMGECLLGPEHSPLFTSLGQREAKKSTLTPDLAGLLTHLLAQAGVGRGDRVAIGASGSFPGLLVAVLAAVAALDAEPVPILSLGASSFGATRPDFHILDLYRFLRSQGFVSTGAAAVSLGGAQDLGTDLDPEFRAELVERLAGDPVDLIQEPDLRRNVSMRLARYGTVAAFVNIGGAEANMGTSTRILEVPPGLVRFDGELPPAAQRGVVFEMLAGGVPVLHLLHVRGLVLRHGLPWDPIPLPAPGTTLLQEGDGERGTGFWFLTLAYAGTLILVGLGWPGYGRKGAVPPGQEGI